MTTKLVILRHYVKQERLHVVVERFRTKKELSQQAEVLTIEWVSPAIDFEERQCSLGASFGIDDVVAVNLVARGVFCRAFELMPPGNVVGAHVL